MTRVLGCRKGDSHGRDTKGGVAKVKSDKKAKRPRPVGLVQVKSDKKAKRPVGLVLSRVPRL